MCTTPPLSLLYTQAPGNTHRPGDDDVVPDSVVLQFVPGSISWVVIVAAWGILDPRGYSWQPPSHILEYHEGRIEHARLPWPPH